jgi:hypothetical protein
MSLKEYASLIKGKTLHNLKIHNRHESTSVGFCFMRKGHYLEQYLAQISGQVKNLIKVEFEVNSEKYLVKSKGKYLTEKDGFRWMTEYCTSSYSTETFKIIRAQFINLIDFDKGLYEFSDVYLMRTLNY